MFLGVQKVQIQNIQSQTVNIDIKVGISCLKERKGTMQKLDPVPDDETMPHACSSLSDLPGMMAVLLLLWEYFYSRCWLKW